MEEKEKKFLKQNYKLLLTVIESQREDRVIILEITTILIVGSFAFGVYQFLHRQYGSSVIMFLVSLQQFFVLRKIQKASQKVLQEANRMKDSFDNEFSDLMNEKK